MGDLESDPPQLPEIHVVTNAATIDLERSWKRMDANDANFRAFVTFIKFVFIRVKNF